MQFCNYPSGESLINPCAHISVMLYLIYISQKSTLDHWMKQSKRNTSICNIIIDITNPIKKFIKKKMAKNIL